MAERVELNRVNFLFIGSDGNLERVIDEKEYNERVAENDPFVRTTNSGKFVEFFNGGMSLGYISEVSDSVTKGGFKIVKVFIDADDCTDVLVIVKENTFGYTQTFKTLINQLAGVDLTRKVKIKPYVKKTIGSNGKEYTSEQFWVTYEGENSPVHSKYTYKKEETVIPPIERVERRGEVKYDSTKQDDFFWGVYEELCKDVANAKRLRVSSGQNTSTLQQASDVAPAPPVQPVSSDTVPPTVQHSYCEVQPSSNQEASADDFDDLPF